MNPATGPFYKNNVYLFYAPVEGCGTYSRCEMEEMREATMILVDMIVSKKFADILGFVEENKVTVYAYVYASGNTMCIAGDKNLPEILSSNQQRLLLPYILHNIPLEYSIPVCKHLILQMYNDDKIPSSTKDLVMQHTWCWYEVFMNDSFPSHREEAFEFIEWLMLQGNVSFDAMRVMICTFSLGTERVPRMVSDVFRVMEVYAQHVDLDAKVRLNNETGSPLYHVVRGLMCAHHQPSLRYLWQFMDMGARLSNESELWSLDQEYRAMRRETMSTHVAWVQGFVSHVKKQVRKYSLYQAWDDFEALNQIPLPLSVVQDIVLKKNELECNHRIVTCFFRMTSEDSFGKKRKRLRNASNLDE